MDESRKQTEGQPFIKDSTKRILMRALLRSVLLIPGPDLYDLVVDLRKSRTTIDEKIDKAVDALKDASRLVSELEESLEERTAKLNTLRQEVERYSKLAEAEEGKAKAIIQQLELSINKGKGIERLVSLALNLLAGLIIFVLGLLLSPLISPYIKKWLGIS
jgi:septal ring factor EnvC (AmiA/AmiB activator)